MTAEAHRYDELHRLVDQLQPNQAEAVRAVVLHLVSANEHGREQGQDQPRRHFSFTGSISAEPDLAERSEEILEEIAHRDTA